MTTSIPLRICSPSKWGKQSLFNFLENPLDVPVRKIINRAKTQQNQGFSAVFGGTTTQMRTWFRVSPVMTTSIPLRICSSSKVRETIVIKFFRKPVRYDGQKNHQPSKSPIKSSFSGGFRWYNYSNAHMISDDTQMCTWFRMTLLLSGNATPSDSFTTALLLYQLGGRFAIVFLKIAQKVFVSKFSK